VKVADFMDSSSQRAGRGLMTLGRPRVTLRFSPFAHGNKNGCASRSGDLNSSSWF
jgi:hypothetical protein